MSNPLDALMPVLAKPEGQGLVGTATVVSVNPLRILPDTDTEGTDTTPLNTTPGLVPSDRVVILRYGRKNVVVGKLQPRSVEMDALVHLDDLTRSGTYHVLGNGNTSTSRGYPVASAGSLVVTSFADLFAEQRYTTWATASGLPRVYVRQVYAGSWRPWAELEAWSQWESLTYTNGWSDTGSGSGPLQFRCSNTTVELRGAVSPGTYTSAVAVLPTAARPSVIRWIKPTAWTSQTAAWRFNVNTNGTIVHTGLTSAPAWVSFDGMRFAL